MSPCSFPTTITITLRAPHDNDGDDGDGDDKLFELHLKFRKNAVNIDNKIGV